MLMQTQQLCRLPNSGSSTLAQQLSSNRSLLVPCISTHTTIARRRHPSVTARAVNDTEKDLEAQVEEFMRRQAEAESGGTSRAADPEKVLGADIVSDAEAKQYCRDVVQVLQALKEKRDMTFNEVRLIVQIEDPRAREQRRTMDIEAAAVSRDEMAAALVDISEGRIPRDRVALMELHREMVNWPFLEEQGRPPMLPRDPDEREVVLPPMGRDPNDKPKGIEDMLPDWMGYTGLYVVTLIPVFITVTVVAVLFLNALR